MILLHNARLIDPESGTDTLGAILIEDGRIAEILTENIKLSDFPAGKAIDCHGKCVAPGIVDIG